MNTTHHVLFFSNMSYTTLLLSASLGLITLFTYASPQVRRHHKRNHYGNQSKQTSKKLKSREGTKARLVRLFLQKEL
jgi:hypothetical protein